MKWRSSENIDHYRIDVVDVPVTAANILSIKFNADGRVIPDLADARSELVVIVVTDALGYWMLKEVEKSHQLCALGRGDYNYTAVTVCPPITPTVIASIATGCYPHRHRVLTKIAKISPECKLLIEAGREAGYKSATIAWTTSSVTRLVSEKADIRIVCQNDEEVCEHTLRVLDSCDVNIVYVHFLSIDWNGHRYGPLADKTIEAILKVDQYVRKIARKVKEKGGITFVLSDHGMHIDKDGVGGHGTPIFEDMIVPITVFMSDQS